MLIEQTLLFAVFTFIAAVVGTISGFGISTIMIPVMLLFYPLPITLLFVGIIHLFGDIWKVLFFKRGFNWKLILGFGVPGILLSYLGASISLNVSTLLLKRLLGVFLLLYVAFLFKQKSWQIPRSTKTAVAGGSLSGFFAGIFGVGGAIRSAFLAAFDLPKEVFIFTSGMIALFIDITRISKYISGGTALPEQLMYTLILLVPISLIGAYLAKRIVNKVPQQYFRLVIAVMLGIIGLKFIIIP